MTADSALTTVHAPASRPWTLTAGAAMAMLLGAVIVAYGVYLPVDGITSHSGLGLTALGGLIVLLMGLLPIAAGRALLRLRRWGRSPAVLMDTLCLAVAYVALRGTGADVPLGMVAAAFGVTGIVLLLHPKTTAALWPENEQRSGNGKRPGTEG